MLQDFPEVVTYLHAGQSYKGLPIRAYVFLDKGAALIGRRKFNQIVKERPGIFINGAHHPREVTGVSMTLYLMMKVLHSWTHKNPDDILLTQMIEKKAAMFFMPIVNIDGVHEISY